MDWHVYPRGHLWGIRKDGSGRCTATVTKRSRAITEATYQAQKTNGVVFVHNSAGDVIRRIPKTAWIAAKITKPGKGNHRE